MSFGFGVGDFIAVGEIAWRLYHEGFLIARGAPQDFRLLVEELRSLHTTMKLFEDEFKDPNSILVLAGEERLGTVKDLLGEVKQVLKGLQDAFDKHRKLGNLSRTAFKRGWDQVKWAAVGAKDVDGLRTKVGGLDSRPLCLPLRSTCSLFLQLSYLNGLFTLLLICAGQ